MLGLALAALGIIGAGPAHGRPKPSISVTPANGPAGTAIEIRGSDFELCRVELCQNEVRILLDGKEITDPTLWGSGPLVLAATVPPTTAVGEHRLELESVLTDPSGPIAQSANVSWRVNGAFAVDVTPAQGTPGDELTVRATGYDRCPDERDRTVGIWWDGAELLGSEPTGRLVTVAVLVPANAATGRHSVTVNCRASGAGASGSIEVQPAVLPTSATTDETTTSTTTGPTSSPSSSTTSSGGTGTPPAGATPSTRTRTTGASTVTVTGTPFSAGGPASATSRPAPPEQRAAGPAAIRAIHQYQVTHFSPFALAILALIVLVLIWPLIGWPAELYNNTYQENADDIRRWLHLDRLRLGTERRGSRLATWAIVGAFALIAGSMTALAQPHGGDSTTDTLTLLLSALLVVPAMALAYECTAESYHRLHPGAGTGRLRIVGSAIALALGCALLSRLLDLFPGYCYGLLVGYLAPHRPPELKRDAVAVLRAAALVLGISVTAWLLWQYGTHPVADGQPPFWLSLLDTALGMTVISGLETVVIGLMPLQFLPGRALWRWSRGAWAGLYALSTFFFALILIGPLPQAGLQGKVADLTRALMIFLVFCIGSWVFWACFALRRRWLDRRVTIRHRAQRPT